jgi:hypothetical protein
MTGDPVDDASDQLLKAIGEFELVAESATPDEAAGSFDEPTLQVFWQNWPHIISWAGALRRRPNETLADAAAPEGESAFHEVGGEGG